MSLLLSFCVQFVISGNVGFLTISGSTLVLYVLFPLFLIMICNSGVISNESEISEENYIDSTTAKEYAQLLDKIMKKEKFFLIPNLKIDEISTHLMLSPGELDYILYKAKNKSFHQYLNDFRILELKEMINIPEYDECDLKCLVNACGFDEYSDFEDTLSRVLNTSPEEFREKFTEAEY